MENNFAGEGVPPQAPQPSAEQARAALSSLGTDRAKLAQQVVTPRWYHPVLGAIVALIICTQALPAPASVVLLPFALFALPVLVAVYRRRYGLWFNEPAGPRSKRIMGALLVVLVLCFLTILPVKFTDVGYWWVLLPATIGFVASVVLGRRYDDVFRDELSGTGHQDG